MSDAGVTSTVAELNYIDGVTSNIQTQLNEKAPSSHSHNVIVHQDTRDINQTPDQMPTGISIHLKSNGKDGLSDGGTFHPLLCLKD